MDQFNFNNFPNTDFNQVNIDWMLETMTQFKEDLDSGEFVGPPGPQGPQGLPGPAGDGINEQVKEALLQLAQKVAYIDNQGSVYYQALYNALYGTTPATLVSISAVYTQTGTVYDTDSLDSLKQDLVVTATYSDSSTAVIPAVDYTLSGSLSVGTSTILVSYSGETTTFQVTVTASSVTIVSIDAVFTQGSAVIYTSTPLNTLKQYLVVTATYSDSSTAVIPDTDYTLSGTLVEGTSVVTAAYRGQTDTFTVTVSESSVTLVSIDAEYIPTGYVFDTDTVASLKNNLIVTATYSDSSTATIPGADYTLSGSLVVGSSTLTVSYQGMTDTVVITVIASPTGYTGRSYIQSNSEAYIDTGTREKVGTTSSIWGRFSVSPSAQKDLFGYQGTTSHVNASDYRFVLRAVAENYLEYYGAGSGLSNPISGWDGTGGINDIYVDFTANATYPVFTVNGVTSTGNKKKTSSTSKTPAPMFLMNQNYLGNPASDPDATTYRRCYGFQIKESGTLVRDYIPVTRNEDGVAGFYDLVSDTFSPSIGTNAFTYG